MKNNTKLIVGLFCIGVAIFVVILAFSGNTNLLPVNLENATSSVSTDGGVATPGEEKGETSKSGVTTRSPVGKIRRVTYTNTGFTPFLTEITAGESIEFVNNSSAGLWVTTNSHPTAGDQGYGAFDTGRTLRQGEAFVFTFTKVGTWGYKNLNKNEDIGAVVVVPQR
jgi:plastocyanin